MLHSDLERFVELLTANGVSYTIIDQQPSYPKSILIWLENSPANGSNVVKALEQFGFGFMGFTEADFLEPNRTIELRYLLNRIDLVTGRPGLALTTGLEGDARAQDQPAVDAVAGDISAPADSPIPVGKRHRTLYDLEMLVYDYDRLGVETAALARGSIFQPWEPADHWRGERVPITLGRQASAFDWGVSSDQGRFLRWDDFFAKCQLLD